MSKLEFIHYCYGFYGLQGGIYKDCKMTFRELEMGYERRLANRPDIPFEGDTVDRELVYEEVCAMREERAA